MCGLTRPARRPIWPLYASGKGRPRKRTPDVAGPRLPGISRRHRWDGRMQRMAQRKARRRPRSKNAGSGADCEGAAGDGAAAAIEPPRKRAPLRRGIRRGDDMPSRFCRRFRVGPFRANVGRHRVSWSVAGRGAWVSFADGRLRSSLGLPGAGPGARRPLVTPVMAAHMPSLVTMLRRALWAVAMLLIAGVALMLGAATLPHFTSF